MVVDMPESIRSDTSNTETVLMEERTGEYREKALRPKRGKIT